MPTKTADTRFLDYMRNMENQASSFPQTILDRLDTLGASLDGLEKMPGIDFDRKYRVDFGEKSLRDLQQETKSLDGAMQKLFNSQEPIEDPAKVSSNLWNHAMDTAHVLANAQTRGMGAGELERARRAAEDLDLCGMALNEIKAAYDAGQARTMSHSERVETRGKTGRTRDTT